MTPHRKYYFALFYATVWSLHKIWDIPSKSVTHFLVDFVLDGVNYNTAFVFPVNTGAFVPIPGPKERWFF